jgi:acyl carrier protein
LDFEEPIRKKVRELAKALGRDARRLSDTDILPKTGLLDSASILELIMWVETEFDLDIDQSDLSLDNFGSIQKIADYVHARKA